MSHVETIRVMQRRDQDVLFKCSDENIIENEMMPMV